MLDLAKKKCKTCLKYLGKPNFGKNKNQADGLTYQCRTCVSIVARRRREENPERIAEIQHKSYLKHRAKRLAEQKAYHQKNQETILAKSRERAKTDHARLLRKQADDARFATRPDAVQARADRQAVRRARKADLFVEDVSRLEVWNRDNGICRLCGLRADEQDWHLEHLTPLSRGGEHSYANAAVSHPTCNRSKGSKTFDEWVLNRCNA
jgi:5-methylcytosine-specific restriction endonuclease McrA